MDVGDFDRQYVGGPVVEAVAHPAVHGRAAHARTAGELTDAHNGDCRHEKADIEPTGEASVSRRGRDLEQFALARERRLVMPNVA